ncbi:LPS export ABC transporter permease LptF [Sutterella sp.]|uniref:LPS export ABC transporter permease LptF n=1 Tax=Sutterella sp. TaxID=1981025 RepID=UPI0026E0F1A6|nr:LPS export ABC transporter permease LptF [Sutterella sp.]MDO5532698.1 LPS export ABC transporter permease LptF [Sutterella sp.]
MIFKRSLISELANIAGGVFTVLFTIVLAVAMVRFLNLAAGGSVDHAAVFQLVLYNALVNLPPLLAASLFIAALMTMMRSWQDNEMVVWFSSGGRSLLSWVEPMLRFALPIVAVIALLSLVISPWARAETEKLRTQYVQRDDVNAIAPGRFIEAMGGKRVFFIESAGENENEVGRVFVAESGVGKESVVAAARGTVETNAEGDRYIVLKDGSRYETMNDSAQTRVVEFSDYAIRLDIRIDNAFSSTRANSLPLAVLLALPSPENQAELLWRFSWPIAALNLVLLAIPLSCTSPRAGRSLNLLMAALIFILYLNGLSVAESRVTQEKLSLLSAFVLLNGSVFLIAVVLFVRRIWMTRWLPKWMNLWYWRERRALAGGSDK